MLEARDIRPMWHCNLAQGIAMPPNIPRNCTALQYPGAIAMHCDIRRLLQCIGWVIVMHFKTFKVPNATHNWAALGTLHYIGILYDIFTFLLMRRAILSVAGARGCPPYVTRSPHARPRLRVHGYRPQSPCRTRPSFSIWNIVHRPS